MLGFIYYFIYLILPVVVVIAFRRIFRKRNSIAFFHPYCDGGGGGERVLFQAIHLLKNNESVYKTKRIIVFSRVPSSKKHEILSSICSRFNILINDDDVEFVQLKSVPLMNPKNFPRFTLLAQSIAELLVAFEAIIRFLPEIFIDTTGCPFSLPLFKVFGGCKTACYVHYPTITTQMMKRVETGVEMYNNAEFIANSEKLTAAKILYYRAFAQVYNLSGMASDVVMVNGSWTEAHIKNLWGCTPSKIFPPVDVDFVDKLDREKKEPFVILSVGQIRPEKNHRLQIEILKLAVDWNLNVRLCIAGGCRNNEDQERVNALKEYANSLNVSEYITWKLNIPVEELCTLNSEALIGIHTMTEEHFGIAVVESMAAGVIMIAHNSGGPKLDIVKNGETGYLATTATEYAEYIKLICDMNDDDLRKMRKLARESMDRFSVQAFEKSWLAATDMLQ